MCVCVYECVWMTRTVGEREKVTTQKEQLLAKLTRHNISVREKAKLANTWANFIIMLSFFSLPHLVLYFISATSDCVSQ